MRRRKKGEQSESKSFSWSDEGRKKCRIGRRRWKNEERYKLLVAGLWQHVDRLYFYLSDVFKEVFSLT